MRNILSLVVVFTQDWVVSLSLWTRTLYYLRMQTDWCSTSLYTQRNQEDMILSMVWSYQSIRKFTRVWLRHFKISSYDVECVTIALLASRWHRLESGIISQLKSFIITIMLWKSSPPTVTNTNTHKPNPLTMYKYFSGYFLSCHVCRGGL